MKPAKPPSKAATEKMLAETAEITRINDAAPNAKEVARALGPFTTTDTPTLVEEPDGKFQVNFTSDTADPEENRRRWGLVNEAMKKKRDLETERTLRRSGEAHTIKVTDIRTDEVREIPADKEDLVARKKWARPGSRKRTYFTGGWL